MGKILSSESEINDKEMTLIRKWVRRLDISDVESEGARKEVEANLNPDNWFKNQKKFLIY